MDDAVYASYRSTIVAKINIKSVEYTHDTMVRCTQFPSLPAKESSTDRSANAPPNQKMSPLIKRKSISNSSEDIFLWIRMDTDSIELHASVFVFFIG
mmetsp:Transcript_11045/g.24363  ORF Transcript_11045/g.24363 Transcript_11045/m.24363 type:complete len:97 (-) Transcript_11045:101-391(-)